MTTYNGLCPGCGMPLHPGTQCQRGGVGWSPDYKSDMPLKEIQSMGFKPDVFTPPPDPSAEEHVLLGPKSKPKPEPRDLSRREFLDLAAKGQVTDEERLIYLESCYVTDELSRDSRTNLARQIRELKDKIEMGLK